MKLNSQQKKYIFVLSIDPLRQLLVSSDCKNKFDLKKKEIKQQKTCYSCLSLKKTKLSGNKLKCLLC